MKFFIDTGDVGEIREAHAMGLVDGVTTNPSLIAKTRPQVQATSSSRSASSSTAPSRAEVLSTTYDEMMVEAREWHKLHKNIVVKLPLIPDGLKAVRTCTAEGIRTNVTLCFSPNQALLAAKAGASYISPFIGRLDDISETGMELIEKIVTIYKNYDFATEVLVASVRNPTHVVDAAHAGRRRLHHPVQRHAAARQAPAHRRRAQEVRRGREEDPALGSWCKMGPPWATSTATRRPSPSTSTSSS